MQHKKTSIAGRGKRWIKIVLLCICPAIIPKIRQRLQKYEGFIREDLKSPTKVSLVKRLWAWKHGYPSKCVPLYNLTSNNAHRYVPDLPYKAAHPINGRFSSLIDSKLNLLFTLGEFREHLPAYYLILLGKEIIRLDGNGRPSPRENTNVILDLCREKGTLAMKRLADSFGAGFFKISFLDGTFRLNDSQISEEELAKRCRSIGDYLVTEFVEQHPYAQTLYPRTTNTLRIMIGRDYEMHEPFIIRVLQKMGTSKSATPADQVALGGLACEVNVDSGEMGPGITFVEETQQPIRYDHHPDTGAPIKGTLIPNWAEIRSKVLSIASRLSMIPYMGWDVVVTTGGFKVLEINSLPGINLVQFFKPLLDDERVRRFYERHIPSLQSNPGGYQ